MWQYAPRNRGRVCRCFEDHNRAHPEHQEKLEEDGQYQGRLSARLCKAPVDCRGHRSGCGDMSPFRSELPPECYLDAYDFVVTNLNEGKALSQLRAEMARLYPGVSDYFLLIAIGRFATYAGFNFGWRSIKRTIEESEILGDAEGDLEASEVRRAFGIYGRGGTPSKESVLGRSLNPSG